MASIHRRPDTPYWHGAWRASDGRLVLRSTKQTDRKKAMAFALECERAEKLAGAGTLTEAQARSILNRILERAAMGETLRSPTVTDYFRSWLAGKEAMKSAGTAARYGISVGEFLAHLGNRARRPLSSLAPQHVKSFVAMRCKAGLSPSTVTLDAKILRTPLNNARRQGLIPTNPAEAVDLPDKDPLERGAFTPAEVKILVKFSRPTSALPRVFVEDGQCGQ
jgi:hypothetical protein